MIGFREGHIQRFRNDVSLFVTMPRLLSILVMPSETPVDRSAANSHKVSRKMLQEKWIVATNKVPDALREEGPSREPVRRKAGSLSVERALSILDFFIGASGPMSLSELTKASGMVKPTVLRCLVSLERAGYIVRLDNARYQLGAKVMQLGTTYRNNFRLEEHVLPVLRGLAAETRESAAFHVREGNKRLCLFRVQSPQAVRDYLPDVAVVMDATATGLVLQNFGTVEEPAESRNRKVYSTSGVNISQTGSLSTAVYGADGAVVGAMTVSGPNNRFSIAQKKLMMTPLASAADRLSVILGSPPHLVGRPTQFVNAPKMDVPAQAG